MLRIRWVMSALVLVLGVIVAHQHAAHPPSTNVQVVARSAPIFGPLVPALDTTTTTTTTTTTAPPDTAPPTPPPVTHPRRIAPPTTEASPPTDPPAPDPASTGDRFDRLAQCESGGNPTATSPNGLYLGAFQWLLSTWHSAGGAGDPRDASYAEQKSIAMAWASMTNPYSQWPVCWPRTV